MLVGDDLDLLVDRGEASPRARGALWAEHGVGAKNVEIGGECVEKEVFGELFDRKLIEMLGRVNLELSVRMTVL